MLLAKTILIEVFRPWCTSMMLETIATSIKKVTKDLNYTNNFLHMRQSLVLFFISFKLTDQVIHQIAQYSMTSENKR